MKKKIIFIVLGALALIGIILIPIFYNKIGTIRLQGKVSSVSNLFDEKINIAKVEKKLSKSYGKKKIEKSVNKYLNDLVEQYKTSTR